MTKMIDYPPEIKALIINILQEPENEQLRLILADWYEENGLEHQLLRQIGHWHISTGSYLQWWTDYDNSQPIIRVDEIPAGIINCEKCQSPHTCRMGSRVVGDSTPNEPMTMSWLCANCDHERRNYNAIDRSYQKSNP